MSTDTSVLGASTFLPQTAACCLIRAAEEARAMPEDSIQRRIRVDQAIRKVRSEYPEFFADRRERPMQRHRASVRGASKEEA